MEFDQRRTARRRVVIAESSYPTSLQLYSDPPNGTISLKNFDEFALERLKGIKA